VPGIGIINNPHSRKNRKNPQKMIKFGYILGDKGTSIKTEDLDEVRGVCQEFKAREIDILGINGGDGSNHVALTTLIEAYGDQPLPKIAFLRGGTMNTISNSFGIKGTPDRILFNLVEKYHLGESFEVVERPIMKIGDKYGFIFGNGVIHSFLDAYYGTGHPSPLTAFTTVMHGVFSAAVGGAFAKQIFKRFRARVIVDGEPWPYEDYAAVTGSTIEQIGLGFKPYYRCAEKPGHFHLLGILTAPFGFAMDMPRIHRGRPMRPDRVIEEVCEQVVFESDEPLLYTIDGDTQQTGNRLELTCGPTLQVIVR